MDLVLNQLSQLCIQVKKAADLPSSDYLEKKDNWKMTKLMAKAAQNIKTDAFPFFSLPNELQLKILTLSSPDERPIYRQVHSVFYNVLLHSPRKLVVRSSQFQLRQQKKMLEVFLKKAPQIYSLTVVISEIKPLKKKMFLNFLQKILSHPTSRQLRVVKFRPRGEVWATLQQIQMDHPFFNLSYDWPSFVSEKIVASYFKKEKINRSILLLSQLKQLEKLEIGLLPQKKAYRALASISSLKNLFLDNPCPLSHLEDLASMEKLKRLTLSHGIEEDVEEDVGEDVNSPSSRPFSSLKYLDFLLTPDLKNFNFFKKMPHLETLRLSSSYYVIGERGEHRLKEKNLNEALSSLTQLKHLSLNSPNPWLHYPLFLTHLKHLQTLKISFYEPSVALFFPHLKNLKALTAQSVSDIYSLREVEKLRNLEELDLGPILSPIPDDWTKEILLAFSKLKKLKRLILPFSIKKLGPLKKLQNLAYLKVNKIAGALEGIEQLSSLAFLELDDFQAADIRALKHSPSLKRLFLKNPQEIPAVFQAISDLTQLKELRYIEDETQATKKDLQFLGHLTRLEKLTLILAGPHFPDLEDLKNLQRLEVQAQNLTSNSLKKLEKLLNSPSLKKIHLRSNQKTEDYLLAKYPSKITLIQ